jgi:hypothetical protein
MVETRSRSRLLRYLAIGWLVLLVPACRTPEGSGGSSSYVAYRPAYRWPETKPLYISGYAGANYGAMTPRRSMTINPEPVQDVGPTTMTIDHGTWESN